LFLAGLPGPARDMGLDEPVRTVRRKVLAALPPGLRDASHRAGQRFHLDAPGWFGDTEPPPLLADLARAVWQDQVLTLRYRSREEVTRTVSPYGLVLKNGVWYLIGGVDAGLRVYRVDRILGVLATGAAFDRDPSFDLPAFWAQRAAEFVRQMLRDTVTIRLSPHGRRLLRHVVEPIAAHEAERTAGEPDPDGWVQVRLPVESVDVAYTYVLGLGPEAEVLEPPQLRARLAEAADRTRALYR
jgi:predicted DNA-binding transcriptional regulator YafY